MFGYVACIKDTLSDEEKNRYGSVYCGICHALKIRFGQLERFMLNFDMTFLAILLTALYEPEETKCDYRCSAHPFHKKTRVENEFIDYAADMTIALSYYKCLDDWKDERKLTAKCFANHLESGFKGVKNSYPRQCNAIEESIRRISDMEQSKEGADFSIDDIINEAGRMLQEVFVYREDYWSDSMRSLGYSLGKFIYLMDAVMDYEQDQKKGSFNPIFLTEKQPEDFLPVLTMQIGEVTDIFEKLPIIQDDNLIRNILYSGVWLQYHARFDKDAKKKGSNIHDAKNS